MNKIATVISNLFDPVPMISLLELFGIFATKMSPNAQHFWFILFLIMASVIGGLMIWLMKLGYVFDERLKKGDDNHRDRLAILWVVNAFLVIAVLIAWYIGELEPLWSVLIATLVTLVVATIITAFYKISFHMIGITSLITVIVLWFGTSFWPIILLVPLLAWSRRVLNRHTPWQLFFGTIVPIGVFICIFSITNQLRWFNN